MKYKLINIITNEEILCDKITIEGFDYYVSDDKPKIGKEFIYKNELITYEEGEIDSMWADSVENGKLVIATNNPSIDIPQIVNEDFWEEMPVKWIKWSKEVPYWNGSVYVQFNGKNQGNGIVHNGKLIRLDGLAESEFDNYFDTFYWLKQDFNYNESQKTHTFTEEDMIDFIKWFVVEDIIENTEKYFHYSDKDILNLWKEQQTKILYYG